MVVHRILRLFGRSESTGRFVSCGLSLLPAPDILTLLKNAIGFLEPIKRPGRFPSAFTRPASVARRDVHLAVCSEKNNGVTIGLVG